jgi:F-type H+-transporting ATPase subunit epsilon
MAHTPFPVEVLTPEGEVFNDEVEMLSTRTTVGSIGILAHHQPLLAMLDPTELRLYKSENDVVRFAQGEGYLQVANNRALVLVEDATPPDGLDKADLQDKLRRAQDAYDRAEDDSEEKRAAARDRRRYEAWLEVAEGS